MDRRELIKAGLAAIAAVSLTGCKKSVDNDDAVNDITPKQTATYRFSTPLPFDFKLIDEMYELNQKLKKSKIVTLYNNLPSPLWNSYSNNGIYACQRGTNEKIKTYNDYKKYVKYAQDAGFNVLYLLNSPKGISEKDYNQTKNNFYKVLDFIHEMGIKDIKIANTQLATLINETKYEFDLSASTAFEYHNILQYIHLVNNYPNIKTFNLSIDENHNFKFLASLKKLFPDKAIELLVNEPCMKGCPARISHPSSEFKYFSCSKIVEQVGILTYFFKTSIIYPWQLEYYSAIGVNDFKIVSKPHRANFNSLYFLTGYLNYVENGIEGVSLYDFLHTVFLHVHPVDEITKKVLLSDVIEYFPDIRQFVKHGHECSTKCQVACSYCYKCADKIKQFVQNV